MNFDILPFTHIDGVPTFTDSEIMRMYDMMERDGTAANVFNQGDATNRSEFLALAKSQNNMFNVILSKDDDLLGVFWLNRFEMKTARLHFCLFREGWPFSDAICKAVTRHIYSMRDDAGLPFFTMIVGIIKSSLERVIKYTVRNGAVIAGTIPDYYWDAGKGKSCEATIVYYPPGANNNN